MLQMRTPKTNYCGWVLMGDMKEGIPEVMVNCAMSADGKIAGMERRQVRISDTQDLARVHVLRNDCGAIIVGVGTVIADDPSLLVKEKYVPSPNQPVRVIIDPRARVPEGSLVLDNSARTIIVLASETDRVFENADTMVCEKDGKVDLEQLMSRLWELGIRKVLVEGGGETIYHFFEKRLVDRFSVFVGSLLIGGGGSPTPMDGMGFGMGEHIRLRPDKVERTESGVILEYIVVS